MTTGNVTTPEAGKRAGWSRALFELNHDEREAFVEGFTETAAAVWPGYDPDVDSSSLQPFCRPWDVEPVVMEGEGDLPGPARLGALWFEHVRLEMAVSPWRAGVR